MEAICSTEMLITTYETTWHHSHNPEGRNRLQMNLPFNRRANHRDNQKSNIVSFDCYEVSNNSFLNAMFINTVWSITIVLYGKGWHFSVVNNTTL
jgi:hypothetical protein